MGSYICLVQWEAIFMHSEIDRLRVHTEMCHHVTVLRIVPGMSLDTVLLTHMLALTIINTHMYTHARAGVRTHS